MSELMRIALAEAGLVVKAVYPYPGVGAVLAKDGHLLLRCHNDPPGAGRHAEVKLFDEAQARDYDLSKCVLYTNLEPCPNRGLTHSCVKALIEAGIREVHVALLDPYHLVRGQGIEQLKAAGVNVVLGEMADEARWQNRRYLERFCPHCGWPVVD